MPSRLEDAQNQFEEGLSYMQKLIDNKERIINWLEELSEWVRWRRTLFDYRVAQVYEYLEDDFLPIIYDIKTQIDNWKLNKRKYRIMLEDTRVNTPEETFHTLLAPIQKLVFWGSDSGDMARVMKENKEAHYGFNKLYDWLDMWGYCISPIERIIRYGFHKEDDDYYYFQWYEEESVEVKKSKKIDKRTIKKYATVDKLEYSVDSENYTLKLYINWEDWVYQEIPFIELGFIKKWGKPNVKSAIFHKLVEWLDVYPNINNRQQVSQINRTFKEILKLENKVIQTVNWIYRLQINKKQAPERVTSDDVLGHHWRHTSLPEGYENMPNFTSQEVTIDKVLAEQDDFPEDDNIVSLDEYEEEMHSKKDDWYDRSENCE